ncbi:hypothetical protein [Bosea sp. (in: a-proteobacteria)]
MAKIVALGAYFYQAVLALGLLLVVSNRLPSAEFTADSLLASIVPFPAIVQGGSDPFRLRGGGGAGRSRELRRADALEPANHAPAPRLWRRLGRRGGRDVPGRYAGIRRSQGRPAEREGASASG